MIVKDMPVNTKTAPRAKIGAGISRKATIPRIVAPTGSRRAIVAVSNDFRLDNEEKYSVCAIAVGRRPRPIKGTIEPGTRGNDRTELPNTRPTIPTTTKAAA